MAISIRTDGPTPHGGDYSVGVYMDMRRFEAVDEAVATGMIITEYARDGSFVHETWASFPSPLVSAPGDGPPV